MLLFILIMVVVLSSLIAWAFWGGMKMPRFTLRELLMLMTICGLMMPYLYSRAVTTHRMDLSIQTVRGMVMEAEPSATILSGSGGNEHVELTCLVPTADSDTLFPNVHAAVRKQIDDSNWIIYGMGSSTSNGLITRFSYDLMNGSSRCKVVGILLDKKKENDGLYNEDVDEVSFMILSPHVR